MTVLLRDSEPPWRPGDYRMVFMVIYQEADGLWHVWASPLAEYEVNDAVTQCIRTMGQGTPIQSVFAPTVEDLAEYIRKVNEEAVILMPPARECETLLPEARPWYSLTQEDRRRIEMERGPASDHDTRVRYHPTDMDLAKWAKLIGRYQRGELES